MSEDQDLQQTRNEVKMHLRIGVALTVMILISIGIALIPFNTALHLVIGLGIAVVMATLVMAFFMHLKGEKKFVHWTMITAAFFFVVLIALTLLAYFDYAGSATIFKF
jgi:cytochrome c oxidase subunit 4